MLFNSAPLQITRILRVRGCQYLVEEMAQAPNPGNAKLHPSCMEEDAREYSNEALFEMELDPEILLDITWGHIAPCGFEA